MKIKIRKSAIIPNFNEYFSVVLSTIITVYLFKPAILKIFPMIDTLHSFLQLLIWIFIIVYFKNLINLNHNGRDLF